MQELEEAKKDNDFIYHERIPDLKLLEPISKAVIAKSIPLPSKLSSKFKGIYLTWLSFFICCYYKSYFYLLDLFENLVPISVQQALITYDVRKAELVNSEIGKLRESTQILNGYVYTIITLQNNVIILTRIIHLNNFVSCIPNISSIISSNIEWVCLYIN